MKKISILGMSLLSVIALSTVLFLNSCEDDPCKDVVCVNGNCVDGTCVCDAGYDGADCSHLIREDYLRVGADVTETCSGNNFTYVVDIIAGDEADEFKIKNLGNYNCSIGDYYVTVTVLTSTTFTISTQTVCDTEFAGSGSIDANGVITVDYTATYDPGTGTVTDQCTAIID